MAKAGGTLVEVKIYGAVFGASLGTSDVKYVMIDGVSVKEIPMVPVRV